ncbi:MAG: glycosyltransferase family 39 protein [Desulfuromusa sp.]|nr:glycosyltransferase family 39 protein [Desulfuromusa sp.]
MESTEARYAEIAREMVVSGNYLEPHYNAIKHFHKPPLAYWLTAAGFKIFGLNNFGARFFGVLAAVLAVFYLHRTARLLLEKEEQALLASCIFSSSILFLVVSRLASTEIYLVSCVVAAQFYLLRQIFGKRGCYNALLYGVWLGLGFAVKGPIILLFTLLPSLTAKLVDSRHRQLFSWREVLVSCGSFCLIALPWYLIVVVKNPELLEYFLKVQTVDRVVTDRFRRNEPPWYFFYIFAVTFFPYTLFLLKGLFRWKKLPVQLKTLLLYIALPMLVFTLAKGKHATYILPFYGSCAILTAGMLARDTMPRLRNLLAWLLLFLPLLLAATGFVYPPLKEISGWLVLAGLVELTLWWQIWSARRRESYWRWVALFMVFFSCIGIWGAGIAGPQMRGYQKMAAELNRLDPERRMETLVFRGFLPSLSFYRNHLAIMAFPGEREIQFQPAMSYRPWYLSTNAELEDFLTDHPKLFVVVRKQAIERFIDSYPYTCEPVFVQHKHSAYLCESLPDPK